MKYFNNIIEIQNGKIGGARKIDFNDNPSFFHITEKFLINSLKSLNYKNGVFHLEAFYDKKVNRWIFSEAAMRVGGGGIPLFFQKFYNKDLFEVASEIFLGRKVKTLTCNTKDIIGCFNIPAPKGRILKLPLKQDFLNSCFNCVDIEWDVVEGENFPDTSIGSFIKVGTVVLKGKSIEDFNNNVQTALSWLEKEIKIE
jgi:hypothetical protein